MTITIDVWPAPPNTNVTLASGFVITAAGVAAALTDEIDGLLRKRMLMDRDPTGVNPNPSPLPPSNTGGVTAPTASGLAALFGGTDGAVATLTAHTTSGDCGGGTFSWAAASTDTIDNAIVCGNPALPGRWIRQQTREFVSARWFGAQGDGVTDDSAAIQRAIDYAAASGIHHTLLPSGVYQIGAPIELRVLTRLSGTNRWATTLRAVSGLASGSNNSVLRCSGAIVHNFTVEHLTVDGGYLSSFDPEVHTAGPSQKHCIYIAPTTTVFSGVFQHLNLWNCSGFGFHSLGTGNLFQNMWDDIDTNFTAEGGFTISGSFSSPFSRLTLGAVCRDRYAVNIGDGTPTFTHCNGLFATYPMKAAHYYAPGTGWGKFGSLCRPTFIDCNFEKFQRYGLYFGTDGFANFNGGTVVLDVGPFGAPGCVRFAYYEGVNGVNFAPEMDASMKVFNGPTGTFGNPDTGVTDGLAIECAVGVPIASRNNAAGSFYQAAVGGAVQGVNVSRIQAGYGQYQEVTSRGSFATQLHPTVILTTATSLTGVNDPAEVYYCNAVSGAFTVGLPQANINPGKRYCFVKIDATANAVTIDGNGGETINGVANVSLAAQWAKAVVQSDGTGGWVVVG